MNSKYFLGELKRSWPQMVLYFIIFSLTMILPFLMTGFGMLHHNPEMSYEENVLRNSTRLLDMVVESVQIWTVVSMIAAIFAGCYVTKILNNKVSADFYHSIPLSRESMYLTRLIAGAVSYLATFISAVLILLLLCEVQELSDGYGILIFKQFIKNFGFSLLSFFMIYATTVFAGMLCGSTPMQLIMTVYLNIIFFVYYSAIFATFDLFYENIYTSYYLSEEILIKLAPFVRLMDLDLITKISVPDICFYAITSLLLLMGSMALYKFRKIEKATQPVVFDGFSAFFRYSVIIPVTLLGGLFFNLVVGSFIWYIIGLIIGGFLCFLLVNTIISKNARKMFEGVKGFAIYAAVMLVVFCAIGFDIFGVNSYIPSKGSVASVEVIIGNELENITFKNSEIINAAIELDRARGYGNIEYDENVVIDKDFGGEYFYTNIDEVISYRIIYKLKSGMPIARKGIVTAVSGELKNFCRVVADSDEYEKYWKEAIDVEYYGNSYLERDEIMSRNSNDFEIDVTTEKGSIEESAFYSSVLKLPEQFNGVDYNYFQRQQIGELHFNGYKENSYRSFNMPIYCDNTLLAPYVFRGMTEEEYYDYLASKIEYMVIYKGNVQSFTELDGKKIENDSELFVKILKNLSNIGYYKNIFTEIDTSYHVGIAFQASDNGSEIIMTTTES
ncbi:MAG: hypothetical protein IJ303_01845, partial [Clostridia bacterium]|nr:hypothetical protein [Clostridia bacterium]